jgi:hypothetical protein
MVIVGAISPHNTGVYPFDVMDTRDNASVVVNPMSHNCGVSWLYPILKSS